MDMKRNDKRIIKELKMIGLHHFELLSLEEEQALLKAAGEEGVILRYRPMEVMSRLEEFVESMNEEFRHTDFTFDFENGMRITLDKEDFFMGVNFRKPGKVETKDMELIQKLIESEGLFFHETGYVEK